MNRSPEPASIIEEAMINLAKSYERGNHPVTDVLHTLAISLLLMGIIYLMIRLIHKAPRPFRWILVTALSLVLAHFLHWDLIAFSCFPFAFLYLFLSLLPSWHLSEKDPSNWADEIKLLGILTVSIHFLLYRFDLSVIFFLIILFSIIDCLVTVIVKYDR